MGRKLKKVGTFVKEHWLDFVIFGGCAIVGSVAGYKFSKTPRLSLKVWDSSSVKELGDLLSDVPGKVGGVFETAGYAFIGIDDIPIEKTGEFGEKIANVSSVVKDSITLWVSGSAN